MLTSGGRRSAQASVVDLGTLERVRICSLVPAATEVLFALGLGDSVVGVTHECDWPPEAASRPVVTASLVETGDLTSAEIDRVVAEAAQDGRPLYAIDDDRWTEIAADVLVMQELCDVCAVSSDEVEGILSARPLEVEVLDFSPSTLDGIQESILALGARLGAEGEAAELVAGMQSRLERVAAALGGVESSPRVFVTEWLEPPYSAGHWVPDMVAVAGGTDVAGMSGEPSYRLRWPDVVSLEPDVVVVAPCGFDLDRTLSEVVPLDLSAHLLGTPARQESSVFAVDANASFSRPGPRVVDGVEVLAHLLHPHEYPDPGLPWSRIRL
jgi:iron complex transport system substrate-binding protein